MQWNEVRKIRPNDGQIILVITYDNEYHVARYEKSKKIFQLLNFDLQENEIRYWASFEKL